MATILITGGTGLIGKALSATLVANGHEVIIATRNPPKSGSRPGIRYVQWDVEAQTIGREAIAAADHIIHLAGAGVAEKRWTEKRKKRLWTAG